MKDYLITIHPHGMPLCASYTCRRALNAGLARRAILKELREQDRDKYYILAEEAP